MSDSNFGSHGNEGAAPAPAHMRPYWKRLHRSWLFWLGMVMVTAAITMYVMSDNLALVPRVNPRHALPGQLGQ